MLKVVLDSFLFIILAELPLRTVTLLGQHVFCTCALFGTLKVHYECGPVVMALDSRSDVVDSSTPPPLPNLPPTIFFFLCQILFSYNIHDIVPILIFHDTSDRFYLYFQEQEKMYQPPPEQRIKINVYIPVQELDEIVNDHF